MIKRGHDPGAGLWSIPGGRIEPGETDAQALAREMLEETNLQVKVGRLIGSVRRRGPGETVIDIRDYAVTVTGGTLRPGDDAADARWVAAGELASLEVTEGLIEALAEWGVLAGLRQLMPGFSVSPDMANNSVSAGALSRSAFREPPCATGERSCVTPTNRRCRAGERCVRARARATAAGDAVLILALLLRVAPPCCSLLLLALPGFTWIRT